MARLPSSAYEHYLNLGPKRSYQAVADHFGVSKVAVVNRAQKECWQDRLAELEEEAREQAERRAVDDIKAVHERQLQAARYLQARAIEALKAQAPEQGIKAASALSIGWKHELLLLGEPTERQANVEEISKREARRWLRRVGDDQPQAQDDPHEQTVSERRVAADS